MESRVCVIYRLLLLDLSGSDLVCFHYFLQYSSECVLEMLDLYLARFSVCPITLFLQWLYLICKKEYEYLTLIIQ